MLDPEKLFAFIIVTGVTSSIPGVSMTFVMGQAIWRGTRSGWAALLGMQIGYGVWWVLAALGLGTLAKAYPIAFHVLALAGVGYLMWLGIKAVHHSFKAEEGHMAATEKASRHAFRDGIYVAIGNPKSLIYMVALIPPFVDPDKSIGWQIALLAIVALVIDLIVGALYIFAGRQLARILDRPDTRRWIDRGIGAVFLLIGALILADLLGSAPADLI